MNKILLSICIPTYNRAKYLDETINSIVSQKRFQETEEVEIVVSDNCSEDNTKEVSENYIKIYGDKIRYYRNSENIKDANFEKVLACGKGVFLKLNNDTLMNNEGTIDAILEVINQNVTAKDIIFFSNGTLKKIEILRCTDLDSFVKTVSFFSTWIGGFGIWKEDFDKIDNFSRYANLQLVQTDVLFRLISSGRPVIVNNSQIFNSSSAVSKGGYSIYQVFVTNYLWLFEEYRARKQISRVILFNEKSKLLIYFLIPWTLTLWRDKTHFYFDKKGGLSIVFKKYWFHPVFYIGAIYFGLQLLRNNKLIAGSKAQKIK
jgi:abequosyltransferase